MGSQQTFTIIRHTNFGAGFACYEPLQEICCENPTTLALSRWVLPVSTMLTSVRHQRLLSILVASAIIGASLSGVVRAQNEGSPAGGLEDSREAPERQAANLTLKQCVVLALQRAFDLRIEGINEDIAKARIVQARSDYDPLVSASLNYRDTTDPGGRDTRTGDFTSSETQSYRGEVTIAGLTPTGGRYTVGATGTDIDGNQGGQPFANTSLTVPFAEFRQPLLENFAIDSTRLNIRVSLQNLQISSLSLKQAMLETINRVEEAYYDLIAARENTRVQEAALQLAEELSRENERRVAHGDMAPIEAAEARSQASTAKASLLLARRQLQAQQNVLKGAMTDDFARWRSVTIVPGETLSHEPAQFDFGFSWRRAMQSRPDLRSLQVQLDQQELIVKQRRNQLLPELDLTAGVGLAGSHADFDTAFEQIRDQDAPYFSLGFSLAFPIGNRRDRANHRIALAESKQAELRLRQFRQSIMIQIDDALNQVKTDYERIAITREAREYAEQALANEQGKLDRGASTNFIVLQLQRNLTGARSEEIQSLTDYQKSRSRLRLAEGIGLDAYQVDLTSDQRDPTP